MTVLETPDGRTLLYDTGSVRGPGVAAQRVAPYLWHRGVRRLDEVFLSHADLDHYNGLRELLDRFAIGRVTLTPTFADKHNAAVAYILDLLEKRGVPVRVVRDGDRFAAGEVLVEVLHPPAAGPDGPENVRSMVLLVRHAGHRLLLTGDLEGEGLARFVKERAGPVDVLMAPHHGSRRLDAKGLMDRTKPAAVVSSQARPATRPPEADPYEAGGARFLPTWKHGAVTFRSHASGLVVETFLSKERFVLRAAGR